MERASLPGVAPGHDRRLAAGGLLGLRRGLEPLVLAARWPEVALASAVLIAGWSFADFALQRHAAFQSNAYDLGFFDQIVWNTSQGRFFETSFVPYSFLGQHFEPVLLAFAAWYRLGGDVTALLIMQAGMAAVAAGPLFYAVRRLTHSDAAALIAGVSYLLNPALHAALDFDFHPEVMAFPFVFLALYFVAAERPGRAILALVPLLSLKEDFFAILLVFAAILAVRGFQARALSLAGFATAWAILVPGIAMAAMRGNRRSDLLERYDYLFPSEYGAAYPVALMLNAADHLRGAPLTAFTEMLLQVGFVAVLNPFGLLGSMIAALPNALSSHPQQAALSLHYAAQTLALLWVAVAFGLARLPRREPHGERLSVLVRLLPAALLLVASVVSFWQSSPYSPRQDRPVLASSHRARLEAALALIPPDAPVSAQSSVLPHLSRRRDVFEFPLNPGAEFVVVDEHLPISRQSLNAGFTVELDALSERGYDLILAHDGIKVFRRR